MRRNCPILSHRVLSHRVLPSPARARSRNFLAPYRAGWMALAAALAIATPAAAQNITLTSDKSEYRVGDQPVFTVTAKEDCFLVLVAIDARGRGAALFPNKYQQDNRIRANVPFKVPGRNAPFQYRLRRSGKERMVAACPRGQNSIDGITLNFAINIVAPVELSTFQRWIGDNNEDVAILSFKVSPAR